MLAKQSRLRKSSDIARVYRRGVYGSGGGFLSVKALASGRSTARVVVVVGKKVDKRAVVRNRIRRRLSGDLQQRLSTLRAGYDIVITVHQDISALDAKDLTATLSKALDRAGAITSPSEQTA